MGFGVVKSGLSEDFNSNDFKAYDFGSPLAYKHIMHIHAVVYPRASLWLPAVGFLYEGFRPAGFRT